MGSPIWFDPNSLWLNRSRSTLAVASLVTGSQTIPLQGQVGMSLYRPKVIGFETFCRPRCHVVDLRLFRRGTANQAQMATRTRDSAMVFETTAQAHPGCGVVIIRRQWSNRPTHGAWPVTAWDGRSGTQTPTRAFWAVLGQLSRSESMPQAERLPLRLVDQLYEANTARIRNLTAPDI
jgi:hypothetical protein